MPADLVQNAVPTDGTVFDRKGRAMNDALTITDEGRDVTVALGAAPAGRLSFPHGAPQLTLRAVPDLDAMLRARFEGSPPKASLDAESIVFRYPRISRPFEWRSRRGEISLSTTVPWEIEIPGGAASVEAELQGLELLGLRIGGGASQVEVALPPPIGAVPVAIGGGASQVRLRRPAEVPVRLQVRGGASKLAFDEQSFGAIGGRTQLQSEGFREAADRYEITIGGGASHLTVSTM
jgi:hypothetical protein